MHVVKITDGGGRLQVGRRLLTRAVLAQGELQESRGLLQERHGQGHFLARVPQHLHLQGQTAEHVIFLPTNTLTYTHTSSVCVLCWVGLWGGGAYHFLMAVTPHIYPVDLQRTTPGVTVHEIGSVTSLCL